MPKLSRNVIDLAKTGHTCTYYIGVKATQMSVFANGIPVLRIGDPTLPHTFPVGPFCKPHQAVVNIGSFKVFAEGIPVARFLDSTDVGALAMGSFDVFAG